MSLLNDNKSYRVKIEEFFIPQYLLYLNTVKINNKI
jgi:hypothetical protein